MLKCRKAAEKVRPALKLEIERGLRKTNIHQTWWSTIQA
jgi:hypothetical protein